MKGGLKYLFRRFCLEGSILGLKYFYLYPDKISRCYWTLILALMLYCSCLLVWLLYSRFQEMPTRVTIENQYESVSNLPYPAITLCSPNQITMSSMIHFNRTLVDGNVTLDLAQVLPKLRAFYEPTREVHKQDMEELQLLIDLNRYNILEVLNALPQSCSSFLRFCIFQQQQIPCHHLFAPLLTAHGLCCVFNSMYHFKKKRNEVDPQFQPRMVKVSGLSKAFTVMTDFEPHDALDHSIINSGGVRILFNAWNEFPSNDEMTMVHSHVESLLEIHGTNTYCSEDVKQLPAQRLLYQDYISSWCSFPIERCSWDFYRPDLYRDGSVKDRDCYFEDEVELQFFRHYRNSECDHLCTARAVYRSCHCYPPYLPLTSLRHTHMCNATALPCLASFWKKMDKLSNHCECPRDCDSVRYNVNTIIGNLRGWPYLVPNPYVSAGLTINHSTTLLRFYFPLPVYVKEKQETIMSLLSLQANLGGVFGLCTGCSIITVVEILFYVYTAVRNYLIKKITKRKEVVTASLNPLKP